jgi:hypothetical protein
LEKTDDLARVQNPYVCERGCDTLSPSLTLLGKDSFSWLPKINLAIGVMKTVKAYLYIGNRVRITTLLVNNAPPSTPNAHGQKQFVTTERTSIRTRPFTHMQNSASYFGHPIINCCVVVMKHEVHELPCPFATIQLAVSLEITHTRLWFPVKPSYLPSPLKFSMMGVGFKLACLQFL